MTSFTEVFSAAGTHSLTLLRPDPDVLSEFRKWRHIEYRQSQVPRFCGVILDPPKETLMTGGAGLVWHLGRENRGPHVIRRDILSGANRLPNASFDLADPELYWTFGKDTLWEVGPSIAGRALLDGINVNRDAFQHELTVDVEEGQQFKLSGRALRLYSSSTGIRGDLYLRPIVHGNFPRANRLGNPGFELGRGLDDFVGPITPTHWTDLTGNGVQVFQQDGAFSRSGFVSLRIGAHHRPNLIHINPAFEDGFANIDPGEIANGWVPGSTPFPNFGLYATGGRKGPFCIQLNYPYVPTGLDRAGPSDSSDYVSWGWPFSPHPGLIVGTDVEVGAQYCFEGYIGSWGTVEAGETWLQVVFQGVPPAEPAKFCEAPSIESPSGFERTAGPKVKAPANGEWTKAVMSFTVPDGCQYVRPEFWVSADMAGVGGFVYDDFAVQAHQSPWAKVSSEPFAVEPGRRYRAGFWAKKDANAVGGEVRVLVVCTDSLALRPETYLTSSGVTDTDEQYVEVALDFQMPDGYDGVRMEIQSRNCERGYWWVDDAFFEKSDEDTWEDVNIVQLRWPQDTGPVYLDLERTFTVPRGADRITVEWVAEAGHGLWEALDTALIRVDLPVTNAEDAIADLLVDEATGNQLLTPGDIEAAGPMLRDLQLKRVTNLGAIDLISRRGLLPLARDYRVRPDGRFDWGLPETLFIDRTDFVLTPEQVEVREFAIQERNSDPVDLIVVVGAERARERGRPRLITGAATVSDPDPPVTFFGEPVTRIATVNESRLDDVVVANAYADYLAEREIEVISIRLRLLDWRLIGDFEVGDWVYLSHPDYGIEDDQYAGMVGVDGEPVSPMRLRVLERALTLGAGWEAWLRRGPDDWADFTHEVAWAGETVAEVVLGTWMPEFLEDAEGGPLGLQLLQFRNAVARS